MFMFCSNKTPVRERESSIERFYKRFRRLQERQRDAAYAEESLDRVSGFRLLILESLKIQRTDDRHKAGIVPVAGPSCSWLVISSAAIYVVLLRPLTAPLTGFAELLAQLALRPLQHLLARRRQALAGPIDVEGQHRHR